MVANEGRHCSCIALRNCQPECRAIGRSTSGRHNLYARLLRLGCCQHDRPMPSGTCKLTCTHWPCLGTRSHTCFPFLGGDEGMFQPPWSMIRLWLRCAGGAVLLAGQARRGEARYQTVGWGEWCCLLVAGCRSLTLMVGNQAALTHASCFSDSFNCSDSAF